MKNNIKSLLWKHSRNLGMMEFLFMTIVSVLGIICITHPFLWSKHDYYWVLGIVILCLAGVVMVNLALNCRFLDAGAVKTGWCRGEQWISPACFARHVIRSHRSVFPVTLQQYGGVGRKILVSSRSQGRQGRGQAHRPPGSTHKTKSSSSGDAGGGEGGAGDDGNIPHESYAIPSLLSLPGSAKLFLSYRDLAARWSCSDKTLRNKVCVKKLPKPLQLPIGPRWPIEIIEAIEAGDWFPPIASNVDESIVLTKYGRGRSRVVRDRGDS